MHVEVKDVSVAFNVGGGMFRPKAVVRAVQDVSFAVPKGKTFAIVGESGSGKSTLARALVGLVRPAAGTIRIGEAEVTAMSSRELRRFRRRVQLVLQDPRASIDPRMTVRQVLREALVVHGLDDHAARIARVIRQVGLNDAHLDRFANELSGGQRQRVAIARAIVVEPEVLVLDEPVSALDVSVQAQIVNLLVDLQAQLGLTYVMITHDLALVSHFADYTGVMYLGRFVEQGRAETVCDAPAHPYTESLLSVVAGEDPALERARPVTLLQGQIPSPLNPPTGCAFHTRCPHARAMAPRIAPERSIGGLPRLCIEVAPAIHDTRTEHACHFPLAEGTTRIRA